jgi:hypothetical protein
MPRVYLAGLPYAEEYWRRATELCKAAGWEVVDPMRRDFRGRTEGHETEDCGRRREEAVYVADRVSADLEEAVRTLMR